MIPICGLSKAVFWRKGEKNMNTRLENTRLDQRPGWAFYSAVFCISYEVKSISGAAENAGKVPGTGVLGIKLASVQRRRVVSHHRSCIFIIRQCEEVFVTKKKQKRTKGKEKVGKLGKGKAKFLGKCPLIRIAGFPSPQPREVRACCPHLSSSTWLCTSAPRHWLAEPGRVWTLGWIYYLEVIRK